MKPIFLTIIVLLLSSSCLSGIGANQSKDGTQTDQSGKVRTQFIDDDYLALITIKEVKVGVSIFSHTQFQYLMVRYPGDLYGPPKGIIASKNDLKEPFVRAIEICKINSSGNAEENTFVKYKNYTSSIGRFEVNGKTWLFFLATLRQESAIHPNTTWVTLTGALDLKLEHRHEITYIINEAAKKIGDPEADRFF